MGGGSSEVPLFNALSKPIKIALVPFEPLATFDALVSTAIHIDNRLREWEKERECRRERSSWYIPPFKTVSMPSPTVHDSLNFDKPMQVDSAALRDAPRDPSRGRWHRRGQRRGPPWGVWSKSLGNGESL